MLVWGNVEFGTVGYISARLDGVHRAEEFDLTVRMLTRDSPPFLAIDLERRVIRAVQLLVTNRHEVADESFHVRFVYPHV
jgi:hypothetical protein